jgi:hypothetical protein
MADLIPQFETEDLQGTTTQYTGTVGTSAISIPTVAGTGIAECLIRCPTQSPNTRRLSYSFDGGTTFSILSPGEYIGWSLKGSPTQIKIKGNVASVDYEVILNREPA